MERKNNNKKSRIQNIQMDLSPEMVSIVFEFIEPYRFYYNSKAKDTCFKIHEVISDFVKFQIERVSMPSDGIHFDDTGFVIVNGWRNGMFMFMFDLIR